MVDCTRVYSLLSPGCTTNQLAVDGITCTLNWHSTDMVDCTRTTLLLSPECTPVTRVYSPCTRVYSLLAPGCTHPFHQGVLTPFTKVYNHSCGRGSLAHYPQVRTISHCLDAQVRTISAPELPGWFHQGFGLHASTAVDWGLRAALPHCGCVHHTAVPKVVPSGPMQK